MRFLLIAATLLAASLSAHAEGVRVERIDVVDTGIYTIATGEETADPNAPTGTIAAVTTVTNVEKTTTIPGRLGLEFGFRYVIVGEPAGAEVPLDFVIAYPGARPRRSRRAGAAPREPLFAAEEDRRDGLSRLRLRERLGDRPRRVELRDLVRGPEARRAELCRRQLTDVGVGEPQRGLPTMP